MRSLFADTFYWIALLHRREVWYSRVVALSRTLGTRRILTTEWVLAEFLAVFSVGGMVTRQRAAARTRQILQDPQIGAGKENDRDAGRPSVHAIWAAGSREVMTTPVEGG
jgi:predicted nucleic acid-binding protein